MVPLVALAVVSLFLDREVEDDASAAESLGKAARAGKELDVHNDSTA